MNVAPWDAIDAGPVWCGSADDEGDLLVADHVQRIAEERARLWWVVRHPYSVDWWSLRDVRIWLIVRIRYMIGKPL